MNKDWVKYYTYILVYVHVIETYFLKMMKIVSCTTGTSFMNNYQIIGLI